VQVLIRTQSWSCQEFPVEGFLAKSYCDPAHLDETLICMEHSTEPLPKAEIWCLQLGGSVIRTALLLERNLTDARRVGTGYRLAGKHVTRVLDIDLRNSAGFVND
jgi:hypothetical protein